MLPIDPGVCENRGPCGDVERPSLSDGDFTSLG